MNGFDFEILSSFNQFVGLWPRFDKGVVFLSGHAFLRGSILFCLFCYAWFKEKDECKSATTRERVIATILACAASLALGRLLALNLPFRLRPIADLSNGLNFPAAEIDWRAHSSFPSDHAIVFATLTTGLFFISSRLAWLAVLNTIFLVCLPRIYLGVHYPTDILGGLAIGIAAGCAANRQWFRQKVSRAPLAWHQKQPGLFYATFFLLMFQLSEMFWGVRTLLEVGYHILSPDHGS